MGQTIQRVNYRENIAENEESMLLPFFQKAAKAQEEDADVSEKANHPAAVFNRKNKIWRLQS